MLYCFRILGNDGPPPWVNFGCKLKNTVEINDFKSLEVQNKETDKGNSEFELLRQGAIAEAATGAVKKVFGGGIKQNTQSLKIYKERKPDPKSKPKFSQTEKEIIDKPEKPAEKVSLFSFLEKKLPVNDTFSIKVNNHHNATEAHRDFEKNNHNKKQTNSFQYSNNRHLCSSNPSDSIPVNSFKSKPKQYQNQNGTNYPTSNLPKDHEKFANELMNVAISVKYEQTYEPKVVSQNGTQIDVAIDTKSPSNQSNKKPIDEATQLMNKISLNSQFARRSLRQHLNLGDSKEKQTYNRPHTWNIGNVCLAKYWEDGKVRIILSKS